MKKTCETRLSHYQGSHGETIRICTQSKTWLKYFKCCINKLVDGELDQIEITSMDCVKVFDFQSLTLVRVCNSKEIKIIKSNEDVHNFCFTWFQDIEELLTLVGLIDGLLCDDEPGHQYLNNALNKVIVELAYKE